MKCKPLFLSLGLVLTFTSFSQISEGRFNVEYTSLRLFEDFTNKLNPELWKPTTHEIKGENDNPFIFTDSITTVYVDENKGRLCLSMHRYPGFTTTNWDNGIISADYVTGEINSLPHFSYGIFECNAVFAHDKGSFPAFWLMSSEPCDTSFNNEIDIVECKVKTNFWGSAHARLQNHIFYWPINCGDGEGHEFKKTSGVNWDDTHTYKCIWDPYKISFWLDNKKLKEVSNSNPDWYPMLSMRVVLSQQVGTGNVKVPQTSFFNWVKVSEFFLAPQITCPDTVYSPLTATLDVDSQATNITWSLTPGYLFTGSTSGTGNNAAITPSTYNDTGKITYSFQMPSGENFSAEKTFGVKGQ